MAQDKAKPAGKPGPAKNAGGKPEGKKVDQQQQPKGRKRAVGVREELQELKEVGALGLWLRGIVESTPGLTTSFIIHAVLLVLLALITLTPEIEKVIPNLLALTDNEKEEEIEKLDENIEINDDVVVDTEVSEVVQTEVIKEEMEISSFNEAPAAPISVETSDFGLEHAPKNNLLNKMGSTTGKGFDGRGEAARKAHRGGASMPCVHWVLGSSPQIGPSGPSGPSSVATTGSPNSGNCPSWLSSS